MAQIGSEYYTFKRMYGVVCNNCMTYNSETTFQSAIYAAIVYIELIKAFSFEMCL